MERETAAQADTARERTGSGGSGPPTAEPLGPMLQLRQWAGNRAFGAPKASMEIDDRRTADALSDDELAAIAAGGGEGAAEAPGDPGQPD